MPDRPAAASLYLDEYEIANLRAGLQTLRSLNLDTGDWLGQILNRLPTCERLPNRAVSVQVAQVNERSAVLAGEAIDALRRIASMPTEERNPDGDEQAAHSMQLVARDVLARWDAANGKETG